MLRTKNITQLRVCQLCGNPSTGKTCKSCFKKGKHRNLSKQKTNKRCRMRYYNGLKGEQIKIDKKKYPLIRGPDGVLYNYAEFEDDVKPLWKEKMRKE